MPCTQLEHARFIGEDKKADTDKGHGRIEKRAIRTTPVKERRTDFPYAAQFI